MSDDHHSPARTQFVTLRLPDELDATTAVVAGDFNEWSLTEDPMSRGSDGSLQRTLELEIGRTYHYRYFVDGARWENDWTADAYEPNDFGGDDSVLDLRDGAPRTHSASHATQNDQSPTAIDEQAADIDARSPDVAEQIDELIDHAQELGLDAQHPGEGD